MGMSAPNPTFRSILAAVDGSEGSQRAVSLAIEAAVRFAAQLTVVYIVEIPVSPYYGERDVEVDVGNETVQTQGEMMVSTAAASARERGLEVKQDVIRHTGRSTGEGITEYASKNGIDLIVVGTSGSGGIERALLGSVATDVVASAHCAVLVVR